jgi:hypothetical protein
MPTIDYGAKFGPPTQDTVGRFRVGGGMYIGPNSGLGGAFRIGGLQLVASPEFHF